MSLHLVPTQLLTRAQLAERLGVSVKTVDRLKADGMPFVTWGRRLTRYDFDAVMRWGEEKAA